MRRFSTLVTSTLSSFTCAIPRSSSTSTVETIHSTNDLSESFAASDDREEGFDFVEASCQEVHDLCLALDFHIRNIGAPATWRRSPRYDKPNSSQYRTVGDAAKGEELFSGYVDKLVEHLDQAVFNRIHASSSKKYHNQRAGTRIHLRSTNVIPLAARKCTTYPRMFLHTPFEAAQLRTDIPAHVVENARCERDIVTMKILKRLTTRSHARAADLDRHLRRLVEIAPRVDATVHNRTESISKPLE